LPSRRFQFKDQGVCRFHGAGARQKSEELVPAVKILASVPP